MSKSENLTEEEIKFETKKKDLIEISIVTTTDDILAKLFIHINDQKVVCIDKKKYNCYYYNEEETLYLPIEDQALGGMVTQTLGKIYRCLFNTARKKLDSLRYQMSIAQTEKDNKKISKIEREIKTAEYRYNALIKILSRIENVNPAECIAKQVCKISYNKKFVNELDINPEVINFKNGLVNLKTGKYRKRTCDDYYSKCLDYDYHKKRDEKMIKYVKNIFFDIFNSDKKQYNEIMSVLGYAITGYTTEQRALWLYGPRAANGKSTLLIVLGEVFSIYVQELDNKTFNVGYSKRHKQYSTLRGIRIAILEELSQEKIDIQPFKNIIGNNKIAGNEVLFSTTETFPLEATFLCTSNKPVRFNDVDEGWSRRGWLQELMNKFMEETQYNKEMKKKNPQERIFIKDKKLTLKCKEDDFKLAFFHILLPYSMNFLNNGMTDCSRLEKEWGKVCKSNDDLSIFVEAHYIITDNDNDFISKEDFLIAYKQYHGQQHVTWQQIVNKDFKRIGLIYDRNRKTPTGRGIVRRLIVKEDDEEK